MSYGRKFLASLPPAPMTDSLAVIERFFAETSRANSGPEIAPTGRLSGC
jgi:hypothetical protein